MPRASPPSTADGAPASLLISGNRAATLKLTNQREALPTEPVLIRAQPWIDLDSRDRHRRSGARPRDPLKGPFQTAPLVRAADRRARRCSWRGSPACCRPCSPGATARPRRGSSAG